RTNLGVADRCPLNRLRGAHLHDREVVFHLDEIEHPARYEVRYPRARVVFGVHHVVGADPLEDPAVLGGDRLRPDELRSDIHEVAGRQHARLEGGADPDDGDGKLPRPELLERFGVGRIRLDDGEPPGPGLDEVGSFSTAGTSGPASSNVVAMAAPKRPIPVTSTAAAGPPAVGVSLANDRPFFRKSDDSAAMT